MLVRWKGKLLRRKKYGNKLARSLKCCCGVTVNCQIFGTQTPYNLRMDAIVGVSGGGIILTQTMITPDYRWAGTFNTTACPFPTPQDWGVEVGCITGTLTWYLTLASSSPFAGAGNPYHFTMIEFHPGGGPGSLTDPPYLIFEGILANCGYFKFKITRP